MILFVTSLPKYNSILATSFVSRRQLLERQRQAQARFQLSIKEVSPRAVSEQLSPSEDFQKKNDSSVNTFLCPAFTGFSLHSLVSVRRMLAIEWVPLRC